MSAIVVSHAQSEAFASFLSMCIGKNWSFPNDNRNAALLRLSLQNPRIGGHI